MYDKQKRYYWHKQWCWSGDGTRAVHTSGLQFEPVDGGGDEWRYIERTYADFAASETARGVPEWQLPTRINALTNEVNKWVNDPRNRKKRTD